jgi:hypothetical protein
LEINYMHRDIDEFLSLFQTVASDTAHSWCGASAAVAALFKGTAYTQRRKDWFPSNASPIPKRKMSHQEYSVLRELLLRTKDSAGNVVNNSSVIARLDSSHAKYLVAMESNDARRHRHLTGRSLPIDAARERVERFLGARGHDLTEFRDFGFFRLFLAAELWPLFANREGAHDRVPGGGVNSGLRPD